MAAHIGLLMIVYAAATGQAVLAPRLVISDGRPDFLLLAAMVAVLRIREWPALVWAAAIGLLGDCLSDRPLGAGMLVVTVVALFVQRRQRERPANTAAGMTMWCGVALFVIGLAREAISAVVASDPLDPLRVVSEAAAVAAYSSSIGLAVHVLWRLRIGVWGRLSSERAG